jgi:hypothetical protein
MKIIELAKQGGGAYGRDVMLAMLRPKLQPFLARFKLSWDDVLPILSDICSLEDLHQVMKSAPVFVLKLVVTSKLRDIEVGDKHVKRITNIIDNCESNNGHVPQLMRAALQMTQGILNVDKIAALVLAVLRLESQAEGTSDKQLKAEAMSVIGEAVQPLVQAKLSVLGVPEATQTRLAALVLQAASEPEQAKAVFTAALPLVQGKPTVSAVEALLLAVLRLDPENKDLDNRELQAQAMAVIGEAVQPLVQGKPLLLAVLRLDPENKERDNNELQAQAMAVIAEATALSPCISPLSHRPMELAPLSSLR